MVFLIFAVFFISVFWHYKKAKVFGFCILFLLSGIWRYQAVLLGIENSPIKDFIGKDVILTGIVDKEPDTGEKITKLSIKTETINLANSYENRPRNIKQGVLATIWHYPEYEYGDRLEIKGKLESPSILDEFDYPSYLKTKGILAQMSWPEIELKEKGLGTPLMSQLFSFKNKFKAVTRKFFSLPQQGFLEALVFGDENNISSDWKEKLNITGVRHIAAVSGMNVSIIALLIFYFILKIGFWRHYAFYISLVLVCLYIAMIGAPASALRAGIMGGLLLLAQHLGRMFSGERAVFFAAGLMLFQNPLLVRHDIGFQLSFLAVLGLIYLQPILSGFFKKIPDFKIFPLKTMVSATLAAQVFALPILVYNFGRISLVSLITNILILPLVAPLTIFIFIFGILAILFLPLGYLFYLPVWFGLSYIVFLVDIFSKIPWASLALENMPFLFILPFYLALALFVRRKRQEQRLWFLNY